VPRQQLAAKPRRNATTQTTKITLAPHALQPVLAADERLLAPTEN
jgi:hypothetical protein